MIRGVRSLLSVSCPSCSFVISRFGPRFALGCGLLLIVAVFILEMSGSAPRMAGSDRVTDPVFAASVPGGGVLCQPVEAPPSDASRVELLVGTYGHPLPPSAARFLSATGADVADGDAPGWRRPRRRQAPPHPPRAAVAIARACLRVGGTFDVAIGGEIGPGANETINGKPAPGVIRLVYLRAGSESWWQLLPTLARRFGLGKSTLFGTWTLPALVVVFVALWTATIRLLWRELT